MDPIDIQTFSPKGRGMSFDGKTEVIGALPGEKVTCHPLGRRKGKRLALIDEVKSPSPDRVSPRCPYVPKCGGCVWQQLDYGAQLDVKEGIVRDLFKERIEKDQTEVRPIQGCEDPWRYRNKMEFSFSENREGEKFLGLMLAGARGRVQTLSECFLVSKWQTDTLQRVLQWWKESDLSAYHHSRDEGHLRTLTLREAKKGKGKMVILTVSGNPDFPVKRPLIDAFVRAIREVSPAEEHLSIFMRIHQIAKGRPTEFFEMPLFGPDHITERLDIDLQGEERSLEFKISPTSFFQPNTLQAEILYSEGLSMLSALEGATVYDLYCGGATLGLSAATLAKEVIGIELNHHSVFDAGWNKEVNELENFTIYQGDVGAVLASNDLSKPDVVIVDPPRSGLDEKALTHIVAARPKEILYISCNPKTQKENIELLCASGYMLKILQPIDQFPHTVHIENIALLTMEP